MFWPRYWFCPAADPSSYIVITGVRVVTAVAVVLRHHHVLAAVLVLPRRRPVVVHHHGGTVRVAGGGGRGRGRIRPAGGVAHHRPGGVAGLRLDDGDDLLDVVVVIVRRRREGRGRARQGGSGTFGGRGVV